jgi:hypothetical protein
LGGFVVGGGGGGGYRKAVYGALLPVYSKAA